MARLMLFNYFKKLLNTMRHPWRYAPLTYVCRKWHLKYTASVRKKHYEIDALARMTGLSDDVQKNFLGNLTIGYEYDFT